MGLVQTYRGPIDAADMGVTLMHEHVFVRNPELETNLPDREWSPTDGVEAAARALTDLYGRGVRTIVDLTVPGLGRDPPLVAQVAERVPVHIVAATGWYTPNALPIYFQFHGPGRLIDRSDPLTDLFVSDITTGMGGTSVRAGLIKVMTDADGITGDVERVLSSAAEAQRQTGVPITTHSLPAAHNGLAQQAFLTDRGVPANRIIIGHSGDSEDLEYLSALMDNGSTIGMDRFGMEHVLPDDRRVRTLVALIDRGYVDRMVLSHDAAIYSHVTPPSWRTATAPWWRMDTIPNRILPMLRDAGVPAEVIDQMLIVNPRNLMDPGR
jgi:phosphotriesterase-related protein